MMLLNQLRSSLQCSRKMGVMLCQWKYYGLTRILRSTRNLEATTSHVGVRHVEPPPEPVDYVTSSDISGELFSTTSNKTVPMLMTEREPIVSSFDEVPGPSSLKMLSRARTYLSQTGTQIIGGALTLGINVGAYLTNRKPTRILSTLFDTYGPVVRIVSPIGGDIVMLNNPHHMQQVFAAEGEYPVRSMLDSLEKFRQEQRSSMFSGLYNSQGKDWDQCRKMICEPLHNSLAKNMSDLDLVCDIFIDKIYECRNCHDEMTKNVHDEVHKWAFDCMGNLIFSKKFTMLNTEIVYSQCDMSWLYLSLERATESILKCEAGLQMWKVFPTVTWNTLIRNCDILDNSIGKYVIEEEQKIDISRTIGKDPENATRASLINSLLLAEDKMSTSDISTVFMDMLLLGVNTVSSSMSFLMYYLAKHQKAQRLLYAEVERATQLMKSEDISKIKQFTPYLQACIKETLRLTPPIPVLTRILPKTIVIDKYKIPRNTLIIMSTQDASLKESNFEDALKFSPERWLSSDAKEYNIFASIPFGFGSRRCLGQNVAETMMSILTYKMIQKFKLEYHYGDIEPTNTFIVKPNKPLKIRFIDRM